MSVSPECSEEENSHNGEFAERGEQVIPLNELVREESNDILSSLEDHGNSPLFVSDTFIQASISSIPPSACSENSKDFLCGWALQNNVTHTALTQLLKWLKRNPDLTDLPSDARTLLHTPSRNCLEQMGSGTFYYFGLRSGTTKIFKKYRDNNLSYSLDFNVDGLPIHKSTKESFWPILCKVAEYSDEHPFPVAIYSGPVKPPLESFFLKFVTELKMYLSDGLSINDIVLNISCRYFCCDTPARSFIKNTKGHNAYEGCDKCQVEGQYLNHKMTFPNLRAHLRSMKVFIGGIWCSLHKGPTPLSELNIGMVSAFPNDYMHSICLGVCRKLLFLWRDGSRIYRFKLEKYNLLENDYQKAMGKLQRLENNLESETESEMKKRKHKKKVYSEYEDDYSEDDLHIPVAPQPKKTTISKPKNVIQSNNNYLQHSPSQNQYDIRKSTKDNICPQNSGTPTTKEKSFSSCKGCEENKALLNELLRRMESMREDIKYLMKLATKNENVQVFVEEFPQFEEIEDINKFNEELSDEKVFVNACTKFQLVGGKDMYETTRKILALLISHKLALSMNWSGRNEKGGFKTLTNIIKLIHVSVRKNPLAINATLSDIENVIKVWLRNAADREGGRSKRK
ncbi:hypothetical protein JTB14_037100 [Gonioctena quinquepunctata]|nr:hypothetical protein JTB14_037100 [Gonioctena quinquepunctata]